MLTHPSAASVPLIVETPAGHNGDGHSADIKALRDLALSASTETVSP